MQKLHSGLKEKFFLQARVQNLHPGMAQTLYKARRGGLGKLSGVRDQVSEVVLGTVPLFVILNPGGFAQG